MTDASSWTAVILAGGLGTRLRAVCPDTPKPLVPVLGRPFLDWLLLYLRACFIGHVVISTGYRAEQFSPYHGTERIAGLDLTTVEEPEPLGTAGGFCHAVAAAGLTGNLMVLNGDSLFLTRLGYILEDFTFQTADAAIIATRAEDCSRYGSLDTQYGYLRGFREKQRGGGMINAGIYLFRHGLVGIFPGQRPLSFETDVFPWLIASGHRVRAYPCEGPFLDIGIPEALAEAPAFLESHLQHFLSTARSVTCSQG